jgi:hypothetical protein
LPAPLLPLAMVVAMQSVGESHAAWPSDVARGVLVYLSASAPEREERDVMEAIAAQANARGLVLLVVPLDADQSSASPELLMKSVHREVERIEAAAGSVLNRRHIIGARAQGTFVATVLQAGLLASFTRVGIVNASPVLIEKPSTRLPHVVIESSGSASERSLMRGLYDRLTAGRIASEVRYRETRGSGFDEERARDFLAWFWGGEDDVIAQPRVRPP